MHANAIGAQLNEAEIDNYAILFLNGTQLCVRLLRGTAEEAEAALELLMEKYDEAVFACPLEGVDFFPLADMRRSLRSTAKRWPNGSASTLRQSARAGRCSACARAPTTGPGTSRAYAVA